MIHECIWLPLICVTYDLSRNSMIHECRRALFNGDTLGSNKLPLEKGEDDQTVESVQKVTVSSYSFMSTVASVISKG
jgi:hypothetical protein